MRLHARWQNPSRPPLEFTTEMNQQRTLMLITLWIFASYIFIFTTKWDGWSERNNI
jgi:hypothetical protein